jgi:hypothetical protein
MALGCASSEKSKKKTKKINSAYSIQKTAATQTGKSCLLPLGLALGDSIPAPYNVMKLTKGNNNEIKKRLTSYLS